MPGFFRWFEAAGGVKFPSSSAPVCMARCLIKRERKSYIVLFYSIDIWDILLYGKYGQNVLWLLFLRRLKTALYFTSYHVFTCVALVQGLWVRLFNYFYFLQAAAKKPEPLTEQWKELVCFNDLVATCPKWKKIFSQQQ
jgi:hypothetical protein